MPIQYTINRSLGIIEEVWTGPVTIEDLGSYWHHYLNDNEVLSLRRTLVDLRLATIKFNGPQLDHLVQKLAVPKLKGLKWKTAIVVAEPLQFGISRQYQIFADMFSKDSIFHDYKQAEAWLRSDDNEAGAERHR